MYERQWTYVTMSLCITSNHFSNDFPPSLSPVDKTCQYSLGLMNTEPEIYLEPYFSCQPYAFVSTIASSTTNDGTWTDSIKALIFGATRCCRVIAQSRSSDLSMR